MALTVLSTIALRLEREGRLQWGEHPEGVNGAPVERPPLESVVLA